MTQKPPIVVRLILHRTSVTGSDFGVNDWHVLYDNPGCSRSAGGEVATV